MNSLRFLSEEQMRQIHSQALTILQEVGFEVYHDEALEKLAGAGARVRKGERKVYLPPELVELALSKVPKRLVLGAGDRSLDVNVDMADDKMFGRTITGCEGYLDLLTGKFRKVIKKDVADWFTLANNLENIDFTAPPYPSDCYAYSRDLAIAHIGLQSSRKHIMMQPYGGINAEYIAHMAATCSGGEEALRKRPLISFVSCLVSPLKYNVEDIETMMVAGKYGLPVHLGVLPSAGGTAPVTIAGIVLSSHAEVLAGITLSQVLYPGTPIIYLAVKFTLDMREGSLTLHGNVESAMASAAGIQLASEYCRLPCTTFGPATDSLQPDAQSMVERTLTTVLPALSGAKILGGAGQVEQAWTMSPWQLVIDNEILGMVKRIRRGIHVDDEYLGLEAIRIVKSDGTFLNNVHTFKHFKKEYYWPLLFPRMKRNLKIPDPEHDLLFRAKEKAIELSTIKWDGPTPAVRKVLDDLFTEGHAKIQNLRQAGEKKA